MTQLTTVTAPTDFDRTTTISPIPGAPGQFSVELDPGWSSLVGVHGGYLTAVAVRGAEALAPGRAVRTLTTSFLRPAQVGPATLTVREVRQGRSISSIAAELSQHGRLLLTTRVTLLSPRAGVEWRAPRALDLPPPEACVRVGRERAIHFERVDGLLDPGHLPFTGAERALVRGYLRPLEPRPVDPAWLAMASDWFPPPAFVRVEPPTGGVSIDLTTHIHQPLVLLGDDEWLTGEFEVETSGGGLAVEHGRIARTDGSLVAESFHTRLTTEG